VEITVEHFADGIATTKLRSWRKFDNAVKQLADDPDFIFRGQRRAEWKLESTLKRELNRLGKDYAKFMRDECHDYVEEFKRATQCRRGPNPPDLDDMGLWALARHYGMPTPVLDWTKSPFAAAFFAFWEPHECTLVPPRERAVFALLRKEIESKNSEIESKTKETPPLATVDPGQEILSFETPYTHDNTRLVNQRGLFCFAFSGRCIEDWVAEHFRGSKNAVIIKFVIQEADSDRADFLTYLNRMNINPVTLFPDIEGAAQYCKLTLEIPSY